MLLAALRPSWGGLGSLLARLGPSWVALGWSWGGLEAVLGCPGRSWGGLGVILGRSRSPLELKHVDFPHYFQCFLKNHDFKNISV